jgi:hypothetical protein
MIERTHAAPAISVMEFKRLTEVLRKKYCKLGAMVNSPERRTPTRVKKCVA